MIQPATVLKFRRTDSFREQYRTGVSLHSHTMHSREFLGRLPGYISRIPIASYMVEREIGKLHLYTGRVFHFEEFYWTPPLSAREAHELEQEQIEKRLGLRALVSLTDHDNVEAGLQLRMLAGTVFHVGVHNLPAGQAHQLMEEFSTFTNKPSGKRLRELFHELNREPSVLLVLNHPFWDADGGVAPERHKLSLMSFLRR